MHLLAAGLAGLAALVTYLPALSNGFVWDDPLVLRQLRQFDDWWDLLIMPPEVPRYYYRPLVFLTYLLDRSVGGETPYWFHLSVVALHLANTLLVYRLAVVVLGNSVSVAFLAALLFAVTPIHVESVAWIAGRADVLACAFLLISALLVVRRSGWGGSYQLAAVMYFLALLAKESAITGMVVIPLLSRLHRRRIDWRDVAPFVVATIAYLLLRKQSGGAFIGGAESSLDVFESAQLTLQALGYYVVCSIAPVSITPYIASVPESPVYLVVGVLSMVAAALVPRALRATDRARCYGLLTWFFLTLMPSFVVLYRESASAPIADRYLYIPSVASCMLLAWLLVALARTLRLSVAWPVAAGLAFSAVLALRSATYARVWADDLSLWTEVIASGPPSALALTQLGSALMDAGRFEDAQRTLEAALKEPSTPTQLAMVHGNLGVVYRRQGKLTEAYEAFNAGARLAPHPVTFHGLGMTLMGLAEQAQGRGDSQAVVDNVRAARKALEIAIELGNSPSADGVFLEQWQPAKTYVLLGQVLGALGDGAAARAQYLAALGVEPNGPVANVARQQLLSLPP